MRFRIIPAIVIPIFLFTFWYYGLHFRDFSSQFSNSTWLQSKDLVLLLQSKISSEVQPFYDKWKDCVNKVLEGVSKDPVKFWSTWFKHVDKCEEAWSKQLEVRGFRNLDETKYHVLPLNKEPSVIVTIGIGHDTTAEEKLRLAIGNSSRFYGADPIFDGNENRYSKFGTFFNFAIGGESGLFVMSILGNRGYFNKKVPSISLPYFLKTIIHENLIDGLWVDAEGAEYSMLHHFYRNGPLDQHNITICQFNIEIHNPNDDRKRQFHKFFQQMMDEERYVFFKPSTNAGHLRIYYFNILNETCKSKYLLPPI